ncbi:hypothetical protein C8R46DRAFT_1353178 [Mycena filopes]|nr:hypothetical protein C8R46DRAFT_1353178 [Mycena filopes]
MTRKDPPPFEYGGGAHIADYLLESEEKWRDLYLWLKESGYLLRPRYSPGWTAPWKEGEKTTKNPANFEDSALLLSPFIMDATRISDGSYVILKETLRSDSEPSLEVRIFHELSSDALASDKRNHCVPAIEILHVPNEIAKNIDLIVMPLLFQWPRYPFSTIGEGVQFISCVFEGLQFLHAHNIWHGDCKFNNILMDASPILRDDPHPWKVGRTRDYVKRSLPARSRTRHPVKYFWIDFDVSGQYDPSGGPPLTDPGYGGTHGVPEWAFSDQCNPFPVDVWCLASFLRGHFTEGFERLPPRKIEGFEFMHPVLEDMSHEDPAKRPTMDVVVARFTGLKAGLSEWKLRSRVIWEKRSPVLDPIRLAKHWAQQLYFAIVYVKIEHSTAGGGTTEVGTVQIQVIDIAMTNRNGGFFECVDEYARELGQLALYFDAYGRLQPNRGCWQPRDFKNERHLVYIQELDIEPAWRGKGLGAWVLRTLLNLPALQGARYLFTWPTVLLRFEPMSANGPFGDPTPTEQAAFLKKRDGIIQFYRKVGFRRLANGHFFCWAKNRSHASHAISIEEGAPFEELPPPTTEEEAHRRYMANQ